MTIIPRVRSNVIAWITKIHLHGGDEVPDKKKIPRRFRRGLRGIVQHVEKREIPYGADALRNPKHKDCLRFVLDKLDDQDNVVDHLPVELSAWRISGQILNNGDEVVVLGKRNRRGFIVPQSIYVVNTRSVIAPDFNWGCFVGVLFMTAVAIVIVVLIARAGGTPIPSERILPQNNDELRQEAIPSVA